MKETMSIITSCYAFSHGFLHTTLLSSVKPLKLCKRARICCCSSSSSSSNKKEEDPEEKEKETSRKNSSSSSLELERGGIVKGFGTNLATPKSSSKDRGKQAGSTKDQKFSTTSRRPSPVKPLVAPNLNPEAQQIENASILALASIGLLIFIEGLALAASGLLPEEWDAVITKFVYPSFTPTVGLFLAGAVFYGVYKILQGNDSENN